MDICKKEKIDLMVDDSFSIVDLLAKNGIPCLQFKADNTKACSRKNVKLVYNWGEVCKEIDKREGMKNEL